MVFYQLRILPGEGEPEGRCDDEWFTSKREALERRRALIEERGENDYVPDLELERVVITRSLPLKQLLLAVLNRRGFVSESEELLGPYVAPPRAADPEDE
jgi:hypothetical protein